MFATVLLVPLVSASDPYFLANLLVAVALAVATAVGLERWLSPRRYARTVGLLGAFVVTGLLALGGNPAAALIIGLIVIGLILAFIAAVLDSM